MTIGLTYDDLKALSPCKESMRRVTALMGGADKWASRTITANEAREAGATFDDVVWAASALARTNKDIERRLRLWMADCAAHVLHIYEKNVPGDARVRDAVAAARKFARGEIDDAAWDAARDAARDAAWAAAWAAAWDAARDAARAAARAAAWAAAWDAARDAARDAAWAAAWAAAWDAARDAARDAEENWQFDRMIMWLGDEEPNELPLPVIGQEEEVA